MDTLLAELQALERELHHPGEASSRDRLDKLLHPDFHEIGKSGRRWDRATVLRYLASSSAEPPKVESNDYAVELLSDGCALLTYHSTHRETLDAAPEHALRSSIWIRTSVGWQLRFHQGTRTGS